MEDHQSAMCTEHAESKVAHLTQGLKLRVCSRERVSLICPSPLSLINTVKRKDLLTK